MIRQLFSAASSARLASSASTTAFKGQIPQPWQLTKTSSLPLHTTRPFSSTPRGLFANSAVPNSTPFRLSSDKPQPSLSTDADYYSAYQPKRQWPPDMSKLSPKHQFRLERKYRRRAALKYARPKFIKAVTLAQWIVIGFVAVYAVLFMNWDTRDTPFDGIREKFFSGVSAVFSSPPPPGPTKRGEAKD
ncbi:hypothetical protein N7492_009450 [Penicillium capsulatum]|uniref:Uncharacterized protein n=1 Tax=Penicillium capsulatum TaxID=69766 RepID=A0A9W9HSV2_9EURO|nr:hypothetical protein N7492_009450 [Penicillium capsulatum]KAJ6106842.1 hypothetical protein N7512_010359 [Penicillium capsulatum]